MSAALNNDDAFAEAFARMSAEEGAPAPAPASNSEPPAAEPAPGTAAEAAPAATAPSTDPAPPQDPVSPPQPEGSDAAGAEPAPTESAPAKEDDDAILARLADLVKNAKAPEPAPAPEPEAKPAPAPQEAEIYTPEEKSFLDTYEKDWPDVARAEALRRRSEYRELVGVIFSEVAKHLNPVSETVRTLMERTQLAELKSNVTDYDTVRDKVVEWVGKQPTYLQVAYNHVIKEGTADEVVDLINRYKREAGIAATPAPPRKPEPELPAAAKQAVASLAPISSKRTAVQQTFDPNDFEGAFAAFADKV